MKDYFYGHHADENGWKPKLTVLAWWIWVIAIGLAIAGVMYAARGLTAPVYRAEGANGQIASLRLSEAPCTNAKVRARLVDKHGTDHAPKFKASVLTWAGRDWASCWIELGGNVFSLDEEGAPLNPPYGIPRAAFRDDSV